MVERRKSKPQLIEGHAGQLELRLFEAEKPGRWVVLSHPHPLFGGTMDNKVVTTMERAFQAAGFSTITYNFRGVGHSEGEHDNAQGEVDDLLAVVHWLKAHFSVDDLQLAGFSFGAYISLKALTQLESELSRIITVAPPVGLYDFSTIHPVNVPWVLIQGGGDEVVSAPEILAWAMSGDKQPDLYWRAHASHFLHGELVWLKKVIGLIV